MVELLGERWDVSCGFNGAGKVYGFTRIRLAIVEFMTNDTPRAEVSPLVVNAASGGVKGGQTIGAADELGLHAIQDKVHLDIHSTIMALRDVDQTKVIFQHKGRPERVDLNAGHVHRAVLS